MNVCNCEFIGIRIYPNHNIFHYCHCYSLPIVLIPNLMILGVYSICGTYFLACGKPPPFDGIFVVKFLLPVRRLEE